MNTFSTNSAIVIGDRSGYASCFGRDRKLSQAILCASSFVTPYGAVGGPNMVGL